jgi:hypothetical protein
LENGEGLTESEKPMLNKKQFLILIGLMVLSCGSPDKLDRQLVGTWMMHNVFEYDKDVTEIHNPSDNRWIEFKEDGSFVSDGDPFGRNTGRWKADHETSVLYLDSDREDDDSEWKVTITGDQLIWTGIGHPRKENTKLVHSRKPI